MRFIGLLIDVFQKPDHGCRRVDGLRDHRLFRSLVFIVVQACLQKLSRFFRYNGRLMNRVCRPVGMQFFGSLDLGKDLRQRCFTPPVPAGLRSDRS